MKRQGPNGTADIVETTIRVRRELWDAVLHRSIDTNMSSQQIVEQAQGIYLRTGVSRE